MADEVPTWLTPHVGLKDGQIAPVVLDRARALHQSNLKAGRVSNPCFFAMDATRPHLRDDGTAGRRFFIICEDSQTFRAVSSGHGSGRNQKGLADFSNGKKCAQNFGNAEGSNLTTGGAYVTAETRTSFKGYYRAKGQMTPMMRAFLQFDGVGQTANARARAIGGHAAVLVRNQCRMKAPDSPHADAEGFVPTGDLVDYAAGRSNGCTSWTPGDAAEIISLVQDQPTTLYIYPEAADIAAAGTGYWDARCLKSIGQPRYWSEAELAPLIARYAKDHPPGPDQPLPICKGQ